MKNPSELNSLADDSAPWGIIDFIHTDGTKHRFYSVVNSLTGSRLSAFDNNAPAVSGDMEADKMVFKNIRKKAKGVIAYFGTKHFA